MSRLISDVLGAPEPYFSHQIQELERVSNRPRHDVRLTAEISEIRKNALNDLKLDTKDTTPVELYFSLRHKASKTNQALESEIGIDPNNSPEEVTEKVISFVESLDLPKEVWAIKQSKTKELLKVHSPKKLLKALGFRSIESVLKGINSYELFATAYQSETDLWKEKMHIKYKKLKPTDFISTNIYISKIDQSRLNKLRKNGYKRTNIVVPNHETGSILLVPSVRRFEQDTLAIFLSLLQAAHDLRLYSTYFRHISVKPDFGERLFEVVESGLPGSAKTALVGWRSIHDYFLHSPDSFKYFEQPHLQRDDLRAHKPEKILVDVLPSELFWQKYVYGFALSGNHCSSMHILDVVINSSNKFPYDKSVNVYLRNRLWQEIGRRYLQNHALLEKTLEKY